MHTVQLLLSHLAFFMLHYDIITFLGDAAINAHHFTVLNVIPKLFSPVIVYVCVGCAVVNVLNASHLLY